MVVHADTPRMASPRESLAAILSIERHRDNEFTAQLEDFFGSALDSDALARATLAAAETCAAMELHSLHAQFVRPPPPAVPLTLRVESVEGGEGRARRHVRILGDGQLCHVVVSFAAASDGPSYQDLALDAHLPPPEQLPSTLEQAQAEGWADYARGPIEFRRVGSWPRRPGESYAHIEWVRPRVPLPDDARLHMAAVVFLSGFYSHWAFERRIGTSFAYDRHVPLDHTLWVHRSLRWNDWWLLKATSEVCHGGRALARREIYTGDGQLVASVVQAALVASRT